MNLSKYQVGIIDHFTKRGPHAGVIAVAGSGKTFTATKALEKTSKHENILLAAFNTSIRDEFTKKIKEMRLWHVRCKNFNGFGWGSCLNNVEGVTLNPDKTRDIFELTVFNAQTPEDQKLQKNWSYLVQRFVSLFKNNLVRLEEADAQIDEFCDRYGLSIPGDKRFRQMLLDTYQISVNMKHIMDFDDQKFMPVYHDWNIPQFDVIVIDEFQDVCPVEMELLARAGMDARFYTFGDPDQAIYSFKGSTPDMFDVFKKRFNAVELPLSICYRCPIDVVKRAQQIVPRIEWAPGAKKGTVDTVNFDFYLRELRPKDFVLCRTTEPLVIDCLRLIGEGGNGKVRGREIGNSLLALVRDGLTTERFVEEITAWKMKKIQELTAVRRENEIIAITDRVNSLCAIAKGTQYTHEIKAKIQSVFTDEKHNGVDYMTIHKSKGLQAPNVWIIRPDLLPHPNAKKEWQQEEEARLEYVGVTRSESRLFFVRKPG